MTSLTTFYLSGIIGKPAFGADGDKIGIIQDLLVHNMQSAQTDPNHQLVTGVKLKINKSSAFYSFRNFRVSKAHERLNVTCTALVELSAEEVDNGMLLVETILDKQIVDLNGRKLVRVNDVRLATVPTGTFTVAVDIGIEGLLRRIGIVSPIKYFLSLFQIILPSRFILWDDVQAIDHSNSRIRLSKISSKLHTIHPSDLADILEDLGRKSGMSLFTSLDEEKAADVLEELEPPVQIHFIENLPINKAADVLEKMPADEAADIIDELEYEKAELLLREMDSESSQEVRDLLEYPDNSVGSLMSTEILSFKPDLAVEDVLNELRIRKPEPAELYNLFVTGKDEVLIGTFTLRDLVVSSPETPVKKIMKSDPIYLYDNQKIRDIAELISKYNLLAVPVVDNDNQLQGMVVVDDVVEDLITERRTRKR
jgi:CBS domain-containing protein/sporulation protein YlmC with PRC-barrel domain